MARATVLVWVVALFAAPQDQPISLQKAEAIIFGKLAARSCTRFLVIQKPLQLLVGTPEAPRIYSTHVLSVFPETLAGPYTLGVRHYETINAFDGSFISDLDSHPSGKPPYQSNILPLEKQIFTHAISTAATRVSVRQGRIAAVEKLESAPKRSVKQVALFGSDIILVANYDVEERLLYFQAGSSWHLLTPDPALLFALMQLFN